jgi:hypothetical protein
MTSEDIFSSTELFPPVESPKTNNKRDKFVTGKIYERNFDVNRDLNIESCGASKVIDGIFICDQYFLNVSNSFD